MFRPLSFGDLERVVLSDAILLVLASRRSDTDDSPLVRQLFQPIGNGASGDIRAFRDVRGAARLVFLDVVEDFVAIGFGLDCSASAEFKREHGYGVVHDGLAHMIALELESHELETRAAVFGDESSFVGR